MKRFYYRYRHKYKIKKIVGIALGIIGVLIIINIIPIEFLLILIGVVLIVMGFLILKTR
ncbi:MAG: hypothetical protein GX987_06195 [Tissierellia bacterium]|nr:hypothetical protein [Tissierellia bacterium]